MDGQRSRLGLMDCAARRNAPPPPAGDEFPSVGFVRPYEPALVDRPPAERACEGQINVALLMKQPSFREFYKTEREPASDRAEVALEEKAPKPNAVTPEERIETAYQAVHSLLRASPTTRRSPGMSQAPIIANSRWPPAK
jgi:hypothetical protein